MFLLRVLMPDLPGTLGTVASALGRVRADIAAIDVVERQNDGTVVDDFVVELPLGGLPDELVSACHSVPGVRVMWFSRYDAGGGVHRDLEAVEVMTEHPVRAERTLVDLAPEIFRGDWAMVIRASHRASGPVADGVSAVGPIEVIGTQGAPDLVDGQAPWLPVERPVRLVVPEGWEAGGWRNVAAAIVPVGDPDVALLVGRAGGPEFLDSEVARLGHLAGLAAAIQRSARRPPAGR